MAVDITSLATLLTSSFALIFALYIFFKDIAEIKSRLIAIETKIAPFWNWIDRELPNMIKGKSGRADVLLTKYLHNPGLTDCEKWELVDLLKDKYIESNDMGEKLAISLFISRLGGMKKDD